MRFFFLYLRRLSKRTQCPVIRPRVFFALFMVACLGTEVLANHAPTARHAISLCRVLHSFEQTKLFVVTIFYAFQHKAAFVLFCLLTLAVYTRTFEKSLRVMINTGKKRSGRCYFFSNMESYLLRQGTGKRLRNRFTTISAIADKLFKQKSSRKRKKVTCWL